MRSLPVSLALALFLFVLAGCRQQPADQVLPLENKDIVTVEMLDDYSFSPNHVDLKGRSLEFINRDSIAHNFSIKEVNFPGLDVGGGSPLVPELVMFEGSVKKRIPPGTYEFFCNRHVDQGMKGTLIIS